MRTDKTLDEQIAALRAEHDAKIAEATRTHQVLARILEHTSTIGAYRAPSVHFYKLYGSVGGLHWEANRYYSLREPNEQQPDAALLRLLLATFSPLPVVKVRDGCVSFRPDLGVSYSTEARPVDEYDCFGVFVRVETFQEQRAHLEWFATVDGELWRFEFRVPWYQTDFGTLRMHANHYGGNGPVANWEICELSPKHSAQRIKWASGGAQYPNSFTLYWDKDSGAALDFPALMFAKVRA